MDQTPRFTDRWLPLLAVALLAECAVVFTPWIAKGSGDRVIAYQVLQPSLLFACAVLLGLLAIATLIGTLRSSSLSSRALAGIALIVFLIAEILINSRLLLISTGSAGSPYFLLQFVSTMILGTGAPLMWAAALARREDPGNLKLQKFGRISAGVVQLGFVFAFIQEALSFSTYMRSGMMSSAAGIYGL